MQLMMNNNSKKSYLKIKNCYFTRVVKLIIIKENNEILKKQNEYYKKICI